MSSSSSTRQPHIVVLGGNGYVGANVCMEGIKRGLHVTSISRSGKPSEHIDSTISSKIDYKQGDLINDPTGKKWADSLNGADAVISCIGGFGSVEYMEKINGDATINGANIAKQHNINRFVFVSAHHYPLPDILKSGYMNGKLRAEQSVLEQFGNNGSVLHPSMVYGTRYVKGIPLPLSIVGAPWKFLTSSSFFDRFHSTPLFSFLLTPPVSVQSVARAAIAAAVPSVATPEEKQILASSSHIEVKQLKQL